MRRLRRRTLRSLLAGLLALGLPLGCAGAADRDALWTIVHESCVPAAEAGNGTGPCAAVDLGARSAILKDRQGATQFLLIPTDRISGIESPALLAPEAPNYWAAAWQARRLMEGRAGKPVPREDVALAVNSQHARSQDQLHIHIDCVRPGIGAILRAHEGEIGAEWRRLGEPLAGHPYEARRVEGENLAANPFRLLAEDPEAAGRMGEETLVVIGWRFADGRPGFVLLADKADPAAGDRASGEELEDHGCAVLG